LRPVPTKFVALLTGLMIVFSSSCKSGDKKNLSKNLKYPHPKPPNDYSPASARQLTFKGENWMASFSPDGKKIIFISKNRSKHKNSQIYEMEYKFRKPRRITYSDGDNTEVTYHPLGKKFLYSSNTDELKENPIFIKQALEKMRNPNKEYQGMKENEKSIALPQFLNTEIYISQLDGSHIQRLTNSPKYDGFPSVHPKTKNIVYSSMRGGGLDLFLMDHKGKLLKRLSFDRPKEIQPQFSPKGDRLAWVKYATDNRSAQIIVGNQWAAKIKNITPHGSINIQPHWHPNGRVLTFVSNRSDPENFEIYVIDVNTQCLSRLTYNSAHESHPSFSPDGSKIVFDSDRSGSRQIYEMDYDPPQVTSKTCMPTPI